MVLSVKMPDRGVFARRMYVRLPKDRQIQILLLGCLALGALGACIPAPQPKECKILLECIYEAEDAGASRPGDALVANSDAYSPENEAAVYAAFGEEGDCWKNGPWDPYYAICASTCRKTLQDDCQDEELCSDAIAVEGLTCDSL
jgi:hypothetical protein